MCSNLLLLSTLDGLGQPHTARTLDGLGQPHTARTLDGLGQPHTEGTLDGLVQGNIIPANPCTGSDHAMFQLM